MKRKHVVLELAVALCLSFMVGCAKENEAVNQGGTDELKVTATVASTEEEEPVYDEEPTVAPEPTAIPEPTATPEPTVTPEPTATPMPTSTPTPEPEVTSMPTEEEDKDATVDCTTMTDEQLMEAYFGEWNYYASIKKDHIQIDYEFDEDVVNVDTDWEFVGSVILEGLILSDEDYIVKVMDGKELKTKVKALKFKSDDAEFLVHRYFRMFDSVSVLKIEMTTADGIKTSVMLDWKEVDVDGVMKDVRVLDVLAAVK